MDAIDKECSFNLVSQICKELGTGDDRLYLAYAERGILRVQDRRYEEGEADPNDALRTRKDLQNYIPRSGEANLSWALLFQDKREECNTLLLNSLASREKALGKNYRKDVRTGSLCYWQPPGCAKPVGGKFQLLPQSMAPHARNSCDMINESLETWSVDPNAHENEIARTTFLTGKLLSAIGKIQKASIALRVVCRLRKKITKENLGLNSLTMEDSDEIVAFWAR
ncbi:hypothetical protein AAEP93_003069 [Penicillium crustosum]